MSTLIAATGPGITAGTAGATGALDAVVMSLNTSPYVSATMMLLLNLGGRFLGLELTKGQEKFFTHPYVRRFLIFCVMFVATRNILIAAWMTLLIILVIGYVANENSALCIFGRGAASGTQCAAGREGFSSAAGPAAPLALTIEEEAILKTLLEKKARIDATAAAASTTAAPNPEQKKKNIVETYKDNLMKLM
jgi:hypothetical protein